MNKKVYTLITVFCIVARTFAQDGLPDAGFGTGGFISLNRPVDRVLLTGTGDYIALGGSTLGWFQDSIFFRGYTQNGSVNTSFGINGYKATPVVGGNLHIYTATLAPGNKILVGGGGHWNPSNSQLVRLNPDCTLDTSFNHSGAIICRQNVPDSSSMVITNYDKEYFMKIIVQPDGKIIVAGKYEHDYYGYHLGITLFRFNDDGTVDNSFGTAGKVHIPLDESMVLLSAMGQEIYQNKPIDIELDATGNIIFNNCNTGEIMKLLPNGTFDNSFGISGRVTLPVTQQAGWASGLGYYTAARCFNLLTNGQIIVAGCDSAKISLARLNANGTLDNTFGNNGIARTWVGPAGANYTEANCIKTQADGKYIVGGQYRYIQDIFGMYTSIVSRFNADGSLDSSFGINGFDTIPAGNSQTADIDELILQPDQKIVGSTHYPQTIFRYDNSITVNLADVHAGPGIFSLYPNPTSSAVVLENILNKNIEITNTKGESIYTKRKSFAKEIIDLSAYSKGLYFVKISDENNVEVKKMILN